MKKKKEIMYDFGTLGSWSKSTLEKQIKKDYHFMSTEYNLIISFIEDARRERAHSLINDIDKLENRRVFNIFWFVKIGEISFNLNRLRILEDKLDELNMSYAKYCAVMTSMQKDKNEKLPHPKGWGI